MGKIIFRVIYFAVLGAIICAGCGGDGTQDKRLDIGEILSVITSGGTPTHDTYTLTVNVGDGGTVSRSPNADGYKAGTRVTVTATPKAGYTFLGWSGAINSTDAEISITMNGDKMLTASFNDGRSTCDVYFNVNGATGNAPLATRTICGNDITLPDQASMERPIYSFVGWAEDKTGTGIIYGPNSQYTVTRITTLYAKWLPIYTVTFNANGAGGNAPPAVTADSGCVITLPDKGNMAWTDYLFYGWSIHKSGMSGNNYGAGEPYTVTGNDTLYARWNEVYSPECYVTYHGNGNTSGNVYYLDVMSKIGSVITISDKQTLAKDGYYFDGWTTDPSGTGTVYQPGTPYTLGSNGCTFYANWVALPNYIVTFDGNGHTNGNPPSRKETYTGNSITLPLNGGMEKNGYHFDGWNTNHDGTGTNYTANSSYIVTNNNVTLYAIWMIETYTIRYNLNDGIVSPDNPTSYTVETATFKLNNPTRIGYRFVGWTGSNGTTADTNVTITKGSTTGNKSYTANWFAVPTYTLSVESNPTYGGNATPNSQSGILAGTQVNISATANPGNTFKNWTISSGNGIITNPGDVSTGVIVNGNVTVMVNFSQIIKIPGDSLAYNGKKYSTVRIGNQTWMAENLNYDTADGVGSWCYDRDSSNCNKYGRLYNWNTAMAGTMNSNSNPSGRRGICPDKWHLPSDQEWTTLCRYAGCSDNYSKASKELKSISGWNWNTYDNVNVSGNGTDNYGFSALPGGYRDTDGSFKSAGHSGSWWTTTEPYYDNRVVYWTMTSNHDQMITSNDVKRYGHSVRCVKDE